MPLKGSGITIPTLEALATGCITVVSKSNRELNEPYDSVINYVENTPEGFRRIFHDVLNNEEQYLEQKEQTFEILEEISGDVMEEKELKIYESLTSKSDNC